MPIQWLDDTHFHLDGAEFTVAFLRAGTSGRLIVNKERACVDSYATLLEMLRPLRIVELGIAQGGSTAMLALLARPLKLVAFDIQPERASPLDEFIERMGLSDVVRPYYGVSQADVGSLEAILEAEMASEQLDLVIDDASHQLADSRTSFEILFPRLRPGGLYVLEDWNWEHRFADVQTGRSGEVGPGAAFNERLSEMVETLAAGSGSRDRKLPLQRLVLELVLMRASMSDMIAQLQICPYWVAIERGPAPIDPSTFRVEASFVDHFGLLAERSLAEGAGGVG